MKVRNVSSLGDLDVPPYGVVKAGQTLDVPEKVAVKLLEQPANWESDKGAVK